ncbi:MAG: L,D-transpeptidase family protein [Aliarcobacter sp.]|nr:L,D-transpeptidase family protein [Aliarcobacter sp.]
MIKKVLPLLLIFSTSSFIYASTQKYTISVCINSTLEDAISCKKRILEDTPTDVFIIKDKSGKYLTDSGIYNDENSAKYAMRFSSSFIKKQRPFIKKLSKEIIALKSKNETFIDLSEASNEITEDNEIPVKNGTRRGEKVLELVSTNPKIEELKFVDSYPFYEGQKLAEEPAKRVKKPIVYTKDELKYREELRQISMEEFDKADEEKKQAKTLPTKIQKPIEEPTTPTEEIKKVEKVEKIEKVERVEAPKIQKSVEPIIEKNVPKLSDTIQNVQRVINYDKAEKKEEVEKPNKIEKIEKIEKPQVKKVVEVKEVKKENPSNFLSDVAQYEQLLIEVDSVTNRMSLKAKIDNEFKEIKTFRVSTGKDNIEKPFGVGKVSKISLNPIWYPTADTIKSFRKRGINLPPVVLPGDKYNYMGAAKINLTHEVDGKSTFRIHGTLNEKTIGTNESAGCIRMKNNEVVQLATLINKFSDLKSLDDVKVILK